MSLLTADDGVCVSSAFSLFVFSLPVSLQYFEDISQFELATGDYRKANLCFSMLMGFDVSLSSHREFLNFFFSDKSLLEHEDTLLRHRL